MGTQRYEAPFQVKAGVIWALVAGALSFDLPARRVSTISETHCKSFVQLRAPGNLIEPEAG